MGTRRTPVPARSKSAEFRDRLARGETVAEIARATGNGYAFVFGVAARTINPATGEPFAVSAANRRPTRAVRTVAGTVEIRTDTGKIVRVDIATGTVRTARG